MNDQLRKAFEALDLTTEAIAAYLFVDPKTVRRWLAGRVPYARTRAAIADLTGVDESDLWPHIRPAPAPDPGIPAAGRYYPHRYAVPRRVWRDLFASAQEQIDILAYSALFLAEDNGILRTIAARARAGTNVRILLGNPDGEHVRRRSTDEGIGDALPARIRNAVALFAPLTEIRAIQLRTHNTPLYASLYRADDRMLVNLHINGAHAADTPVIHVASDDDAQQSEMFALYTESFMRTWYDSAPTA